MVLVLQVMRGGALAGLLAAAILAVALVLGIAEGAPIYLYLIAAIGVGIYFWIPSGGRGAQVAGSAVLGGLALLIGAFTGFGALEIAGLAGSIAAVAVTSTRATAPTVALSPKAIGVTGVGIAAIALIPLVVGGETLGHDESAYALKGRSWLEGTPDTGWSLHRGPALSAYAYLVLALGGEEAMLRALGLLSVVALAAATWWLGGKIGGRRVGPLAAVGIVAGPAILRRGTEFLTDIPAAALLLACMVIVWRQYVEKETPGYGLLWVLPFAWLAFYLRYQSILSVALIGISIVVIWWDRVKSRPGPLVWTAVLGFIGLIPHLVFSESETGSPIGILTALGEAVGGDFIGQGLGEYALQMGWPLAGFVGPIATVAFVWWFFRSWRDASSRTKSLFLLIPAAGQVIALGLFSHAEPRFVFFPLALTVIGGVVGVLALADEWSKRRVVTSVLVALLVGSLALSISQTRTSVENRILANEPVELAAETIDELDPDDGCAVMTSYLPQVTFYSLCWTDRFRTTLPAVEAVGALEGTPRFMILVEDGKRQPAGSDLEELAVLTTGEPIEIEGERDDAVVYEFDS